MKHILILGGTKFVGRNITEFLNDQEDYELTLFNRAISNPNLFKNVKQIQGDRDDLSDVKKIFSKSWDYIIDVSCYYPHQLRYVLQGSFKQLKKYIFISTCSVYDNDAYQKELRDERAPTLACSIQQETDKSPSTYGNRKAACERALIASGLPYTILRPALIYGKYDPTDRLYYWLYQVKSQQEIILPENGERKFSITFIDDLVNIVQTLLESKPENQIFNCISSPTTSIAKILETCEAEYQRRVSKFEATAEFLEDNKINQWSGIPLWLNSDYFTYSNQRVLDELSLLPTDFKESIRKTIDYYDQRGYLEPEFGIKDWQKRALIRKLKG
ncbi:MAG: NAD-dependent epimerase/dehydratase family protein [Bacteroidota bacterium]